MFWTHPLRNTIIRIWQRLRASALQGRRLYEDVPKSQQECCVGFFGLNRSLDTTIRSIKSNIEAPLSEYGFDVVVAAHFNLPRIIHSPRSGERYVRNRNRGIEKLKCEMRWLEPQNEANINDLVSLVLRYPVKGMADPDGVIRKNALFQLQSKKKLLSLLRLLGLERFKVFCLARADLLFLDRLPKDAVLSIVEAKNDVITPIWQKWGGFNDRFALCSRQGAEVYLNQIEWVKEFCEQKGYFHPEELLRFSVEQAQLRYSFMEARAKRVRATGVIKEEDFSV